MNGAVSTDPRRPSFWCGMLVVLLIATGVFFFQLGQPRLWDRDEPRNSGCALEMLERGDLIVPVFNGQLRHQKPVLLYWLMIACYQIFGVNEFSARCCSALFSLGTVAVTYTVAWKLFDRTTAWLSGVMLATSVMFVIAARAATPDAILIFFSTVAIGIFIGSAFPKRALKVCAADLTENKNLPPLKIRLGMSEMVAWRWTTMGVSMGLAVLAKGPVGFLMPMAICGMFLLLVRHHQQSGTAAFGSVITYAISLLRFCLSPLHFFRTLHAMRPLRLMLLTLAVAAPWYIWVGIRTEGKFLRLFFVAEHWQRSTEVFENHGGGFGYYPLAILIGFFPWSLLTLPVSIITWRRLNSVNRWGVYEFGMVMMLVWVVVQMGIFSLVKTKLPSYVTPCYPAVAILMAAAISQWMQKTTNLKPIWMKLAMATTTLTGVGLFIGLWITIRQLQIPATWLALAGLFVLAMGAAGWHFVVKDRRELTMVSWCAGAAGLFAFVFGCGAAAVSIAISQQPVLEKIRSLPASTPVASYRRLEPSWVFYGRRRILETSQLEDSIESFVRSHPSGLIITDARFEQELLLRLPQDFRVVVRGRQTFDRRQLILIQRP